MPPALSEHDSSDIGDDAPAMPTGGKGKKKGKTAQTRPAPIEQSEDDDSEVGDDEYVVEAIHGHRFVKGALEFDVKWEGYDDAKDRTWETEENMESAADVLTEYFERIGGRPEPKGHKRKSRKSDAGVKSETGTPIASTKRVKAEKAWSPPPGSWEHDVDYVDNVEETSDPNTGEFGRFAYLVWKNHNKTQHPLKHVYQKCPQKMLTYYESHLVFTNHDAPEAPLNGTKAGSDVIMKG